MVSSWQAPADDLRMLGGALGALPDRQVIVIEPGAVPTPVGPSEEELLRGSTELADYLAGDITVRQDGVPCEATVDLTDLLGDGALAAFSTAAFGSGTTPANWMYTSGDTSHTWSFDDEAAAAEPGSRDTADRPRRALAGGLIPSPSAFLVLIGGLLTGRGWFATAMVLAFGVGLAATVLAAGLLTLAGRDWLARLAQRHRHSRRFASALARLPLLGGVAVVIGGLVLASGAALL